LKIDQGDARGSHLVVIGISLGVFADMTAFHDHGAQA
jgi:hypothetical protein